MNIHEESFFNYTDVKVSHCYWRAFIWHPCDVGVTPDATTYFSRSTQHFAIKNLHFDEFNFLDRNAEYACIFLPAL